MGVISETAQLLKKFTKERAQPLSAPLDAGDLGDLEGGKPSLCFRVNALLKFKTTWKPQLWLWNPLTTIQDVQGLVGIVLLRDQQL